MASDVVFVSLPDGRWRLDTIVEKLQLRLVVLQARVEELELAEKRIKQVQKLASVRAEKLASVRAELHMEYIARLENLVTQICAELKIPVPFQGSMVGFRPALKPKKG